MKTLYDISVTTMMGDTFKLKGVSYSLVTQLANQFEMIKQIDIDKEYSKRISYY